MIASSQVSDPRAAQQVSALFIIPLMALMVSQAAGKLVVSLENLLVGALLLTALNLVFLVDGDRFDTTNLNRQILSTEALVGHPKAEAARSRVMAVNSEVRVTACNRFLDDSNVDAAVDGADIVA